MAFQLPWAYRTAKCRLIKNYVFMIQPSRLTYSLHTYMSTYSKYSDTGIISIYFSSSPVNKQSNLKYLAKTVLTVCSELSKPLTAVSFSLASLKMQSFLSLVSYRTGIFNGAVIISMQLAETLTEGETDLLITDTDNEWWESKLSILITFPDWNTGCVIFSVAMETWHHISSALDTLWTAHKNKK